MKVTITMTPGEFQQWVGMALQNNIHSMSELQLFITETIMQDPTEHLDITNMDVHIEEEGAF